jgi:nitroreductase
MKPGNNMENFSELIKNRRSMRKFTDEELTQDEVVTLMKAALMSPSSKRSNSWQFVVVDDKEMLKELSHCKEQASSFIADAALAIVVMADPLASDVWIEDAAIASIMIQLQAEDLGLGSCWVQVRERFTATGMPSDEFVHGILDIPLQLQILSVIAIGHKAMERKPFNEEHLQWEKIHINKFGAAKANNSKDTYMATAVTFMVIGALYLIDKLIHFSSIGLPWVMNKDNMLLYASICFLIFKRDKSIGFVLLGLWLVMNIGLVMSLLGSLSGYLLPLTLLIIGIILFWIAKR